MSSQDPVNEELLALEEETMKIAEQVQAYQRKLMTPVFEKRRAIAKNIPNFWGQTVSCQLLVSSFY